MGNIYPSVIDVSKISKSELDVYMFLKNILPDSYYIFHDIRINDSKPDFIVVGPELGVMVLEVKAWSLNYILSASNSIFTLRNGTIANNPFEQAEKYRQNAVEYVLQKEDSLLQTEGRYINKLRFPRASGVVFTNIERDEFLDSNHVESIDSKFILFKDDLVNIKDADLLIEKLNSMFISKRSFLFTPLSQNDMDLIKQILYRESNISYEGSDIDNTMEIVSITPIPTSIEKSIEDIKNDINNISELITQPQKQERVRPKSEFKTPVRLKRRSFIVRIIILYFKFALIFISISIFLNLYFTYKEDIHNFVGKFNINKTTAFSKSNEFETTDSKPVMTFKVENNPKGYSTYIVIKDGQKYLTSKSFAQGSSIEFYDNKKVIIYDAESDKKEFDVENDVIDLEVGNAYTKVYLEGEEYKFVKYFKYDFVNKEIITKKK